MAEKSVDIKIKADTSDIKKDLKELNSSINSNTKLADEFQKALKFDSKNTVALKEATDHYKEAIEITKEKLERLKQEQSNLKAAGIEENTKEFKNLELQIAKTENQLSQYKQEIKNTDEASKDHLLTAKDFMDALTNLSKSANNVLGVMAKVGIINKENAEGFAKTASNVLAYVAVIPQLVKSMNAIVTITKSLTSVQTLLNIAQTIGKAILNPAFLATAAVIIGGTYALFKMSQPQGEALAGNVGGSTSNNNTITVNLNGNIGSNAFEQENTLNDVTSAVSRGIS